MQIKSLVSIIVPVYNVEDYLNECIDSLIKQTYENIEIIIVDDGSTDSSGELCDICLKKDERIRVVHQANGGLSAARNKGLSIARGKLVAFVDSDDYVNEFMIETMVKTLEKYNADICCCDYTSDTFKKNINTKIEEFNSESACASLLDTYGFKCYAWNKIYKMRLFESISYPEGKYFEDIVTTYKLFQNAKKIVYMHEELYFYRIRSESITRNSFSNKNYDLLNAINDVLEMSMSMNKKHRQKINLGYMQYYLTFLKSAYLGQADVNKEEKVLRKFVVINLNNLLVGKNISKATKLELLLFLIHPKLFKGIYRFSRSKR